MYRDAAIGVLIAVLILMIVDCLFFRALFRRRRRASAPRPSPSRAQRWSRVSVNLLGLISFVAVVESGFYSLFTDGSPLSGDRLMLHVGAAPAFAIGSALVMLFWAHRNRFTAADWIRLRRPLDPAKTGLGSSYALVFRKLFFWMASALFVPAAVSITIAMFPLFGPTQQEDLFLIHRYCALPLAAAGLLFSYFSVVTWYEEEIR